MNNLIDKKLNDKDVNKVTGGSSKLVLKDFDVSKLKDTGNGAVFCPDHQNDAMSWGTELGSQYNIRDICYVFECKICGRKFIKYNNLEPDFSKPDPFITWKEVTYIEDDD